MINSSSRLGVVFDLDGTLVNSMPMVLAAFAHSIQVFQKPPSAAEIFSKLTGPADICLRSLLEEESNLPMAMDRLLQYNARNNHQIVPFEGAAEMLELLLKNRADIALWTGRDRATTMEILEAHSMLKYFQVVVCGDDFPSHKPDPEGLAHILKKLSLQNSDVLFVGDADVDVLAGHAMGVPTVMIRHERNVSQNILRLCRDWVEWPQQAYELVLARVATAPLVSRSPV